MTERQDKELTIVRWRHMGHWPRAESCFIHSMIQCYVYVRVQDLTVFW